MDKSMAHNPGDKVSAPGDDRGGSVDPGLKKRGKWSGKSDFAVALIGFSVGLGNVWRFPYLCYKNGGGVFLIPYFICLFLGGIPMLMLEIGLGQLTSQGAVTSWGIVPIFKGIGIAMVVMLALVDTYYTVIMAWALYYMVMSFRTVLPWSTCDNDWNTDACFVPAVDELMNCTDRPTTTVLPDDVTSSATEVVCIAPDDRVSSTVEFWERKILQIHLSTGIDDIGGMNWQLTACLIVSWVLIYLCVCKGVKSTGKVVYFTATFPYILLTILLVRAVTLPNASEGIIYFLRPDISRLADSQVWLDAATQIFFSYCLAVGTLITLGSFNRPNHNFIRDAIIYACVNSGTSVYSGFLIFAVIGYMAGIQKKDVSEVAAGGPGLAFIVYPEGLAQMPAAPVWSVMFFFVIILLGIDSEFGGVEAFVTALSDLFPSTFHRGYRREVLVFLTCVCFCCCGFCMTTHGGMYIFQLFDHYSASGAPILWVTMFEAAAIGWVYGSSKMASHLHEMTGWKFLNRYLQLAWTFITPAFTAAVFIHSLVKYEPLKYNNVYVYPTWGYLLGWMLALSSMIMPPVYMIYKLAVATKGSLRERWALLTTRTVRLAVGVGDEDPMETFSLDVDSKDIEVETISKPNLGFIP